MGKNKIGGKGHKKKKNNSEESSSKQLLLIDSEQNYGKITLNLGSCRFELMDPTNKKYIGIVRGNMRKKIWIKVDDIVIFSHRSFQDNKVDIIHKYNDNDIPILIQMEQLTSNFATTTAFEKHTDRIDVNQKSLDVPLPDNNDNDVDDDDDDGIIFDDI